MKIARGLLPILLCCAWAMARAGVYTWVDDAGVRHYSDRPVPGQQAQPAGVKESLSGSGARKAKPKAQRVRVLRPQAGATLTSAQGMVRVSVVVAGALGATEQLVYYLDGRTVAESPTRAQQFQLVGVSADEHALQVALLDGKREVFRTEPVSFVVETSAPAGNGAGRGDKAD